MCLEPIFRNIFKNVSLFKDVNVFIKGRFWNRIKKNVLFDETNIGLYDFIWWFKSKTFVS